jgi:hypothetical protein
MRPMDSEVSRRRLVGRRGVARHRWAGQRQCGGRPAASPCNGLRPPSPDAPSERPSRLLAADVSAFADRGVDLGSMINISRGVSIVALGGRVGYRPTYSTIPVQFLEET